MTGEASTAGANIGLDAMTGRATQTARTTYLVLLTSAPSDTTTLATMSELSATGYARQSVTWSAPASDPSESHNTNVTTFGAFSTDPANVTHLALVSASSGTVGDFIFFWTAASARDAASGDSISVAASGLSMTLD